MSRKPRRHAPNFAIAARQLSPHEVELAVLGRVLPDVKGEACALSAGAIEARELLLKLSRKSTLEPSSMTVSLYTSTASGKKEVIVQTNAQSLDLFVVGLADAIDVAASQVDIAARAELLASVLKNAIPIAFAIAGYKAEKVAESRTLVCGSAAPDKSSLLAHSRT